MSASGIAVVLCTAPAAGRGDRPGAAALARALVDEGLCACVNQLAAVRSVYRWQGAVHEDDEVLLVIKTVASAVPALTARIVALHPYELPEVLVLPVADGSADYLQWLRASVPQGGQPR